MRARGRSALLAALAAVAAVAAIAAPASQGGDTFRVDVVFDDSRGLLVGQLVQVAGATVGSITDVSVTPDYKARVHMEVDRRFAPFREDATCTIKPSGLIAENYVQCDPGSPDAPPLEGEGDEDPTVPVENTTQPVSLTDLFEVWNTPTRQRAGVLLSTLGLATAGQGENLNDVLRRMNPTLGLARETIATLESQRDELVELVERAGRVADELAKRDERLEGLVAHAGRVATEAASERGALEEGLRRLPALLSETRPALARLDALSADARPLVDALGEAAPGLNRLSADVPRLARAARPTLEALAPVLAEGARTARDAEPLASAVAGYAQASLPVTATAAEMFPTLEDRGFFGTLLRFFHNGALATARYDETSHIIPAHVTFSACGNYATEPDPDCGGDASGEGAGGHPPRKRRERTDRGGRREEGPQQAPRDAGRPGLPHLPDLPRLPGVRDLPLPDPTPGPGRPGSDGAMDELLEFLFG